MREADNVRTGAAYKKIVLADKTQITFIPAQKDVDEAVIVISDIPSWIVPATIELRFAPQEDPTESLRVIEQLHTEKQAVLQELLAAFEKLPEEDQKRLAELYEEVVRAYSE